MSRLTAAIRRAATLAANWRCRLCDTYNAPTDIVCHCCGGPS